MELLHERCAALDIGKKDLKACVRTPSVSRRKRSRSQEIRTFATTTNALLELRDWLVAERVSLVVLEATGDYWRGAFYLLEVDLNVILVNAAHAKGLPGRNGRLATPLGCVRWVRRAVAGIHWLREVDGPKCVGNGPQPAAARKVALSS